MTQTSHPETILRGLYIVATPIGNLGDITLRARQVLQACDVIACEDTRVTGKLLKLLEISGKMMRYDDHAKAADRQRLLDMARDGSVALVSDAGMPLISDPGYRLVSEARAAGITVTALPGASAPTLALAMSGLPNDRFMFAGFLPQKEKARADLLAELAPLRSTLIFFDTAPRLTKSLAAIVGIMPAREVAVARELTKLHEECRKGSAEELLSHYQANPPKGEIVLLIGPPGDEAAGDMDVDAMLIEALKDAKTSQAASHVAKATGLDRKMLYARAMELKAG